eukprot:Hpha_TRINITY_DN31472_c0_g1::TRINITY_DN31472_c0_g1_i1::g.145296::m.145296
MKINPHAKALHADPDTVAAAQRRELAAVRSRLKEVRHDAASGAEVSPCLSGLVESGAVSRDETGNEVLSLRVQTGAAELLATATEPAVTFVRRWFEARVGCLPEATKAEIRRYAEGHAAVQQELKSAMEALSRSYCMPQFSTVAYSATAFRVGYLLKFAVYNACLGGVALRSLLPPQHGGALRVLSLGGGPGTDWLAARLAAPGGVECVIWDLPCWGGLWDSDAMAAGHPEVRFAAVDLTTVGDGANPMSMPLPGAPEGWLPDVVTCFYTANECATPESARRGFLQCVVSLMRTLRSGALLVLLDRTREQAQSVAEELVRRCSDGGLAEAVVVGRRLEVEPPLRWVNRHGDLAARFGVRPRLQGKGSLTALRRT